MIIHQKSSNGEYSALTLLCSRSPEQQDIGLAACSVALWLKVCLGDDNKLGTGCFTESAVRSAHPFLTARLYTSHLHTIIILPSAETTQQVRGSSAVLVYDVHVLSKLASLGPIRLETNE